MDQERYYLRTRLNLPYNTAIEKTKEALLSEGFGILTEIDVKATLKKKLGIEFKPYTILGACNPSLAHVALQADRQIGLLLPCNLVVQEAENGSEVSAINPEVAMQAVRVSNVEAVACKVAQKLKNVITALERG